MQFPLSASLGQIVQVWCYQKPHTKQETDVDKFYICGNERTSNLQNKTGISDAILVMQVPQFFFFFLHLLIYNAYM